MRRDLALAEFRKLPAEKQFHCRAAVPLFNAQQAKHGRKHTPNFHLWIRTRGFEEFPGAKLVTTEQQTRHWVCGDELAGLQLAAKMVGAKPYRTTDHPELGPGYWSRGGNARADLAAMALFERDYPDGWIDVEQGTPQFAAWRDRLQSWLGYEINAQRVWLEDYKPEVHGVSPMHANFKLRKAKHVLRVPTLWPPKKDGSTYSQGENDDARNAG